MMRHFQADCTFLHSELRVINFSSLFDADWTLVYCKVQASHTNARSSFAFAGSSFVLNV